MQSNRVYITPEDYNEAEENGISKKVLNVRVYRHGWSLERAKSEPVRRRSSSAAHKYHLELMKKNGIKYRTYNDRIVNGWDPLDAATKPLMTPQEYGALGGKAKALNRKYGRM
jgi:hypothetical protein